MSPKRDTCLLSKLTLLVPVVPSKIIAKVPVNEPDVVDRSPGNDAPDCKVMVTVCAVPKTIFSISPATLPSDFRSYFASLALFTTVIRPVSATVILTAPLKPDRSNVSTSASSWVSAPGAVLKSPASAVAVFSPTVCAAKTPA